MQHVRQHHDPLGRVLQVRQLRYDQRLRLMASRTGQTPPGV